MGSRGPGVVLPSAPAPGPSFGSGTEMTDRATDDGYTLGLLVDLRDLCTKIGDSPRRMAAELHDL